MFCVSYLARFSTKNKSKYAHKVFGKLKICKLFHPKSWAKPKIERTTSNELRSRIGNDTGYSLSLSFSLSLSLHAEMIGTICFVSQCVSPLSTLVFVQFSGRSFGWIVHISFIVVCYDFSCQSNVASLTACFFHTFEILCFNFSF